MNAVVDRTKPNLPNTEAFVQYDHEILNRMSWTFSFQTSGLFNEKYTPLFKIWKSYQAGRNLSFLLL